MPYPGRPVLEMLPQFAGTATVRQTAAQRRRLLDFCARQYAAGRSIHEVAQLTGRSQTAVRRALDQADVPRRGRGAPPITGQA